MAQDKNLPEGTDKVTPGASVTVEEVVVVEKTSATKASAAGGTGRASGTGSQSSGQSSGSTGGTGTSGGTRQKIIDQVRTGKDKVSGQAAGKAREFVGQGLERSSDALGNVSRLVGETAEGIDERLGKEYGDYARRAAEAIDSTARKLRSKDPDELIDDTRDFVRKSPGVALAGAAVVGFALARLVKSGLDAAMDDDDDGPGGTTADRSTGSTGGTTNRGGSNA